MNYVSIEFQNLPIPLHLIGICGLVVSATLNLTATAPGEVCNILSHAVQISRGAFSLSCAEFNAESVRESMVAAIALTSY